jgi:hypothetical protein
MNEAADLVTPFHNAMVGKTPSGFNKIRIEMKPDELRKIVGYDPRGLQPVKRGSKIIEPSKHVSQNLTELQSEVQRSIDNDKVAEMVAYLHAAVSSGNYADWAEIDVVTTTQVDTSRFHDQHVVYVPTAAEYFIIDGQHRYCALIDFVRLYPELARKFTQAVAISVIDESKVRDWAGQGFHDKNYLRTAVKATKALAVDSRDIHNVLAKSLHNHPVIIEGGGVNVEKDSLAASSQEMVTHAILYKFVRGFCEGRRGLDKGSLSRPHLTEETFKKLQDQLSQYVTELYEVLPNWTNEATRGRYLFRASPAWQALGVIGNLLSEVDDEDDRRAMIELIGESELDWTRENLQWESVIGNRQQEVGDDGKVVAEWISPRASRQAIDGTIGFLKQRTGLTASNDDPSSS